MKGSVGSCLLSFYYFIRKNLIKNSHTKKICYTENIVKPTKPCLQLEDMKAAKVWNCFLMEKAGSTLCPCSGSFSWLSKYRVHCLSDFALMISRSLQTLFVLLEIWRQVSRGESKGKYSRNQSFVLPRTLRALKIWPKQIGVLLFNLGLTGRNSTWALCRAWPCSRYRRWLIHISYLSQLNHELLREKNCS